MQPASATLARSPPTMPDAICNTADRPMLADPEGAFAANYNRQRLQFRHGLAGHALFGLDSPRALAARMPDHSDTYWSNGPVDVAATWETGRDGGLTLDDTIAHIARNNALVILKHAEQDAEFGRLLRDFPAPWRCAASGCAPMWRWARC